MSTIKFYFQQKITDDKVSYVSKTLRFKNLKGEEKCYFDVKSCNSAHKFTDVFKSHNSTIKDFNCFYKVFKGIISPFWIA